MRITSPPWAPPPPLKKRNFGTFRWQLAHQTYLRLSMLGSRMSAVTSVIGPSETSRPPPFERQSSRVLRTCHGSRPSGIQRGGRAGSGDNDPALADEVAA